MFPPSGHAPSGYPQSGESRDSSWLVRSAPLSRLAELAPLALAPATEDRKTIVLSLLADLLQRSASHDLFLAEIVEGEANEGEPNEGEPNEGGKIKGGQIVAAAIAIRTADDSASLVAAHALSAAESSGTGLPATGFGHLLGHLHQCLAEAGVTFIQAMREAEVAQAALVSCGYRFLATLDYRVAARRVSPRPGSEPKKLHAIPYETFFRSLENGVSQSEVSQRGAREGLVALIDATYVDSLDCPQLEQFRSAAAMVDCYRRSPAYDPRDWQVLVDGGDRPLGCLLATAHPASGSLEITYMGLIPEARHRGSAGAILERGWEIADRYGLPQLTLAVDRANHPAIKLYQRHGFEVLMSETVWGRSLGSEREISQRGEFEPTRTMKEL